LYFHGSWNDFYVNDREVGMRKNLIIVILVVAALVASSAAVSTLGAQSRTKGKEFAGLVQRGAYQIVADSNEGVWVLDVNGGRVKHCTMNDFGAVSCSAWSTF
jgi:hypothetical protein